MNTVTSYREWLEALDGPEGEPIVMGYATERLPWVDVPSARITSPVPTVPTGYLEVPYDLTDEQVAQLQAQWDGPIRRTRSDKVSAILSVLGWGGVMGAMLGLVVVGIIVSLMQPTTPTPEPTPSSLVGVPLIGEVPSTVASVVGGSPSTVRTPTRHTVGSSTPTTLATGVGTVTTKGVESTTTTGGVGTTATGVVSTTGGTSVGTSASSTSTVASSTTVEVSTTTKATEPEPSSTTLTSQSPTSHSVTTQPLTSDQPTNT